MKESIKVICPFHECHQKVMKHSRRGILNHYLRGSKNELCPKSEDIRKSSVIDLSVEARFVEEYGRNIFGKSEEYE